MRPRTIESASGLVMLKGSTLTGIWGDLRVLVAWLVGGFLLALGVFRWQ